MSPVRVQRQRVKGWRMPENTVSVCRPGKWGNPFAIKSVDRHGFYPYGWKVVGEPSVAVYGTIYHTETQAAERAVHLYRGEIEHLLAIGARDLGELRGKNLACWCAEGHPCHADVLLEIANKEEL